MPVDQKQRLRTPPNVKQQRATAATPHTASAEKSLTASKPALPSPDLAGAVKSSFKDAFLERRPYLKFAFANPYNLTLLLGALAASAITLNPFIAIAALGMEGL